MEIIIKIETKGITVARELACDYCNRNLIVEHHREPVIYAFFWRDTKDIYLEKYICEDCYRACFKVFKAIPFKSAPEDLKKALERDFKRDWHCIMVPCSSIEEFKLLQDNPFLIDFWGEKI